MLSPGLLSIIVAHDLIQLKLKLAVTGGFSGKAVLMHGAKMTT
jgi:hypothetical protein